MSQNIKKTELNLVAKVAERLGNGGLQPGDVRALLEAESSLVNYGRGVKAPAGQTMWVNGTQFRRHINGGGWVPVDQDRDDLNKPHISDEAYVGPQVIICGRVKVFGGEFHGGEFDGGTFHGGTFCGGWFRGGEFRGGTFRGGEFRGGTFCGGWFRGGWFRGGEFRGGIYDRTDKVYHSTADADSS